MLLLRSIVRKSERNRAWWLEDEGEICPACSQAYAYQTQYYCVGCDGAVCALCIQHTIEVEIFCPGCIGAGGAESGR